MKHKNYDLTKPASAYSIALVKLTDAVYAQAKLINTLCQTVDEMAGRLSELEVVTLHKVNG